MRIASVRLAVESPFFECRLEGKFCPPTRLSPQVMAQIPHSVLQQVYMYSIQKQNIQSSFLGPPLLGGG